MKAVDISRKIMLGIEWNWRELGIGISLTRFQSSWMFLVHVGPLIVWVDV